MNRYLFKMRRNGNAIIMSAKTKDGPRWPYEYWLDRDALWRFLCGESRTYVIRDGYDYVELGKANTGIRITLTHLNLKGSHDVSGRQDEFIVDDAGFRAFVGYSEDGSPLRCLNMQEFVPPKIVVKGKNIRAVAKNPVYRRKFAKFMRDAFKWYGATEIELSDDFVPYSFYFVEKCGNRTGMCGGVILHGQDNPPKAKYSIHT